MNTVVASPVVSDAFDLFELDVQIDADAGAAARDGSDRGTTGGPYCHDTDAC